MTVKKEAVSLIQTGVAKGHQIKDRSSGSTVFRYDALLEASHGLDFEIPKNPLQEGSYVNEHIQENGETVRLSGVVTNTPIDTQVAQLITRNLASPFPQGNTRSFDAYTALVVFAKSKRVVTVVTRSRTYESMVIARIGLSRSSPTDALRPVIDFAEWREVSSETVSVPNDLLKSNAPKSTADESDDGEQGTEEESTEDDGLLSGLADDTVATKLSKENVTLENAIQFLEKL